MLESLKSDSLEDIEEIFKEACKVDRECIDSIVELAWFNLNVNDDPKVAISLFKKALNAYSNKTTEVVHGIAKCLAEIKSSEEAINYLETINIKILDMEEIKQIKEEFLE